MIYNETAFKKATKNLNKELSELGFELSHGATLNLLARTLGHNDYNTIKPTFTNSGVDSNSFNSIVSTESNIKIADFINSLNSKQLKDANITEKFLKNKIYSHIKDFPSFVRMDRHGYLCYSFVFYSNGNSYELVGSYLKDSDYFHIYFIIHNGIIIDLFDEQNSLNTSNIKYFDDKLIDLMFKYFNFNDRHANCITPSAKREVIETYFLGYNN